MIFQQLAGLLPGQAQTWCAGPSPKKKAKQIEQEREAFIYGDPERDIKRVRGQRHPREYRRADL